MKKHHQGLSFAVRYLFVICLSCSLAICLAGRAGVVRAEVVDRIIAQVNADIVTLHELNKAMGPHLEKIRGMGYPPEKERQMMFQAREMVLNELISNKLIDQEVRETGVTIGPNEIDSALERVKEMNQLTERDLVEALAQEGLTLEGYREDLKHQLLRRKLMSREIRSKIVITDVDIKKYYDAHPEKYAGKKTYRLRSIIKQIPIIADEKRVESINSLMRSIMEQLKAGASFAALAREHSDLLADEGGELGVFELDALSPEIREAVAGLQEGEYSSIVDTRQGYQIFYVEEISHTREKPIASVSEEIKEMLYEEEMDKKFSEWVAEMKSEAHIKIMK